MLSVAVFQIWPQRTGWLVFYHQTVVHSISAASGQRILFPEKQLNTQLLSQALNCIVYPTLKLGLVMGLAGCETDGIKKSRDLLF